MKKHWYQWGLALLLALFCFSLPLVSSPSAYAATSPEGTQHLLITHASASDPYGDPYATGCASHIKQGNHGTLELEGFTVAQIYNYYSTSCNKNWVYVSYNTNVITSIAIDIHKKGTSITSAPGGNHQCYPTDCVSGYSGRLSPTWSDMVDGTPINCIWVGVVGPNNSATSTYDEYGTLDTFCA